MHSRRARPTLRVLTRDLTSAWDSPYTQRALDAKDYNCLHPLSELPHPIIAKAAESFQGNSAADDSFVGIIAASTRLRLLEIKTGQWRGAIWQDQADGTNWLIAAGLAKGGHQDHDDFYVQLQRANDTGAVDQWLPTAEDRNLLKKETAAALITQWELGIQEVMLTALRQVHAGGEVHGSIPHPMPGHQPLAAYTLTVTQFREPDYAADEVEFETRPQPQAAGSELLWQAVIRALIALNPPEQDWDRDRDSYMTIAEPGTFTTRLVALEDLVTRGELGTSEPGTVSHYTHRKHIADSTVDGTAVRALCGVFFVPTRDHLALKVCPDCETAHTNLPA
jgi:hypothetical protein